MAKRCAPELIRGHAAHRRTEGLSAVGVLHRRKSHLLHASLAGTHSWQPPMVARVSDARLNLIKAELAK